jgi:hypothetical protein
MLSNEWGGVQVFYHLRLEVALFARKLAAPIDRRYGVALILKISMNYLSDYLLPFSATLCAGKPQPKELNHGLHG